MHSIALLTYRLIFKLRAEKLQPVNYILKVFFFHISKYFDILPQFEIRSKEEKNNNSKKKVADRELLEPEYKIELILKSEDFIWIHCIAPG